VLCFSARSWVSASLDGVDLLPRKAIAGRREEKSERGWVRVFPSVVFPFCCVSLQGWVVLGGRFGRGVRPSSVACPCCFSRSCSLGCPKGLTSCRAPGGCCSLGRCGGLSCSLPCLGAGRARSSSPRSSAVSVSCPFLSFIIP
jgi:hypothetical protein